MRIVLNHVTRMSAPRICVAGIDEQTEEHVRPTTNRGDLITRDLLLEHGGTLSLGALVDVGEAPSISNPPEVEDRRCAVEAMKVVGRLDDEEYLELLRRVSEHDLDSLFGPDLERQTWSYAVEAGRGSASLGVLRPHRRPELEIDEKYRKLKLRLNPSEGPPAYLSVTDVRFVEGDHRTIREDRVEDVQRRLRRGVDVFLMLGLARPWRAAGDDRDRHWLQVNGICMVDRPLGDAP
jgi:hypothetical protein